MEINVSLAAVVDRNGLKTYSRTRNGTLVIVGTILLRGSDWSVEGVSEV